MQPPHAIKPVDLDDFDKKLGNSVREKIAQVRSSILNGSEATRAQARLAAIAKQAAPQEGQTPGASLQAHERAAAAILEDEKRLRRHPVQIAALASLWLIGPLLVFEILAAFDLTFSKLYLALGLSVLAAVGSALILGYRDKAPSYAVLAAVLPTAATTETEMAYCTVAADVYGALAHLGLDEAHRMLISLNSLLNSSRSLATQADAIGKAMGLKSLVALEDDRKRLHDRLQASQDAQARHTLAESLAICDAKLEQARRIAPVLERIEAQQEAISQTMESLRASVASLDIASMETFALPNVAGPQAMLLETTRDLHNRAIAVQQAVQEVAALHAN